MAEEELQVVRLKREFYRDGFTKILLAIALVLLTMGVLASLSVYLFVTKPDPVYFATDNEWRILPPVPVDRAYLSNPELLQWVGKALPASFTYDFLNYKSQQQEVTEFFTSKGWQNLLGQLKNYHVDEDTLQKSKMFVNAQLTGAPFILNQGVLPDGRYAWRVQIPMNVSYSNNLADRDLVIIALVVRVPTLDYLSGVGIEDLNISEAKGNVVTTNG